MAILLADVIVATPLWVVIVAGPSTGVEAQADDIIYYEIQGVLTSTAIQFAPGTVVEMTADFITTGPIRLKVKTEPDNKVLQENTDDILLDQDATAKLLQEADG